MRCTQIHLKSPARLLSVAVAVAVVAATVAGCSGDSDPKPSAETSTTSAGATSTAAPSEWYQPPVAFEGLDPCSLATPSEVSGIVGKTGLSPSRNEGLQPDMTIVGKIDTCSWMQDRRDPVAVSLGIGTPQGGVKQGHDSESLWMAEQLGHPAELTFGKNPSQLGVEDCVAFVGYSNDRSVSVLLRLPAASSTPAPTDTDNLCVKNRTVLRDIFARVLWN
ncbi:DUF3558 family protein [Nocardia sp. NPDC058640]|uniref:DUF3558 family protein n=1 Tax=Nocardia sp. NPDC058640 TaxID=3346571 RepID=UPI00364A33A4